MDLAAVDVHHAESFQPVRAFAQHQVAGEGVHRVELDVVSMRDQGCPAFALRMSSRNGDELEVARAATLIRDDEEAVALRFTPVVLDGVLVAVIARRDDLRLGGGRVRGNEPHLGRELRRRIDEHEAATARSLHSEIEALVVFAQHAYVVGGGSAEHVAPYLVGPHRVIGPDVEACAHVVGPSQPVGHVVDDIR